jgi:Fe-S-cluster containining protein
MNTKGMLFTKIELPGNDIVVPFICRRCGTCCMTYIPRVSAEDLTSISGYLQWPTEDLISRHAEAYLERLRGRPEPCIFLTDQRLCRIYSHPLRPEVCRLYPFSFGGTDADCDAYLEHTRVVAALLMNEESFEIYDASFCPNRDFRLIPDAACLEISRRLGLSNASEEMIGAFWVLNGAPVRLAPASGHLNSSTARSSWRSSEMAHVH